MAGVMDKITEYISSGNYYEAQQHCLTTHTRLLRRNSENECLNLLFDTCSLLCPKEQFGSALDLAKCVFKVLEDRKITMDDELCGKILLLIDQFQGKKFNEIVNLACKWSRQRQECDSVIHHHVAFKFHEEGELDLAAKHFLLGTLESAESLAVIASKGNVGSLCLKYVVGYLCDVRFAHASRFMDTLFNIAELGPIKKNVIETPFLSMTVYTIREFNFAQLIFLCAMRGPAAVNIFKSIRKIFKDLDFDQLDKLDKIFGIQRNQPFNMMDLFK